MEDLKGLLVGLDDPFDIVWAIKRYAGSKAFLRLSEAAAERMVTHLFSDAGRTWRQAARKNSRGRQLYELLQTQMKGPMGSIVLAQIRSNAEIIRTLPLSISEQVNAHVLQGTLAGLRASVIAEQIKAFFPDVTKAKAGLIARTETSKTQTALTQARSELLGLDWYIWRTSKDSRVRDSHKLMDGVLIKWAAPPSPEKLEGADRTYGNYHAGCIFNCRCYPEPVIDLDLIQWPALVYHGGSLRRMTRRQFERIA
ncbi:phage minor head protein [Paenibacillus ginsengarvi]|nr:phage minor head protein [Paenibacillus ginsengarvi]